MPFRGRLMRARDDATRFMAPRVEWVRRKLLRRPPSRPIERVIFEFGRLSPTAFFVQIGAHDGTALDPLREQIMRRRWSGILIEPVPYVFSRLCANYGDNPRVVLENVAVADRDGRRDFYYLPEAPTGTEVWKWYDALGSFHRDVVLSHRRLIPDIDDRIETIPVPCLTFDSICRKHGVNDVAVVQIDTEGYDFEVLKLIDFNRYEVQLVMYEHLHLDPSTKAASRRLLNEHGYVSISDGMDVLAVHGGVLRKFPRLDRVWKRLQAANRGEDS
jgi:FkbM family methyltransferase